MKSIITLLLLTTIATGAYGFGPIAQGDGYPHVEEDWIYTAANYDRDLDGLADLLIVDDATATIRDLDLDGSVPWSFQADFAGLCPGCGEFDYQYLYFEGFFAFEPGHRDAVIEMYAEDFTTYESYRKVLVVSADDASIRYEFDGYFSAGLDLTGDGYDEMILNLGETWQIWSDTAPVNVPAVEGAALQMRQNRPNPFNPATVVAFSLDSTAQASVEIHDLAGRLVLRRDLGILPAGDHEFPWSGIDRHGRSVAAGSYTCTVTAGDQRRTRKMMLVK